MYRLLCILLLKGQKPLDITRQMLDRAPNPLVAPVLTGKNHCKREEKHFHRRNENSESEATALLVLRTASVPAHITGKDPEGINFHNPVVDMKWKTFKEGRRQTNKQTNQEKNLLVSYCPTVYYGYCSILATDL